MTFARVPLVLLALISMTGSTCRSRSDAGETASKSATASAPEFHIKEIDTSSLTPRERREWTAQIGELLAPCPDTPVSIAQCVAEKRACKSCVGAAEFLLRQVQAGKPKKDREAAFHDRFDPAKIKTIVLDGSPEKGPADAAVTIVEWADFECPFCRLMSPLLDELVSRFEGQVRIVYKFYPLGAHPHGLPAARAAIAAGEQGKFWQMHHLLFENQTRLELADLERYARQLDLDMPKFKADMVAKSTTERVENDKKQAEGLGLDGTPFLFINGREVGLERLNNPYDDLEAWVKLDIELAGHTPRPPPPKKSPSPPPGEGASAPTPATSASAAPAAAPKP
jgi:protein-disulfide isomerase